MATINTAALPTKSDLDSMQYVDEDSPVGTIATPSESTESETINSEFLNDDIFGEIIGDDDDSDDQRESVPSEATDDNDRTEGTKREHLEVSQCVSSESPIDPPINLHEVLEESVTPIVQPARELSDWDKEIEAARIAFHESKLNWDEEAEKRKDETAFFERLKELNSAIDTAEANLEEAKEEAKLAKATLNLAIANQKHFTSKGVQYRKKPVPQPIAEPVKPVASIESNVEGSQESKTEEPKAVPASIPESEWRAWETETILDGIEGLGAKKRETLIEHFPTFGKLMDARTEAGKEHVPFHSLLPKGIGESIGTELIQRMDAKIVPGM